MVKKQVLFLALLLLFSCRVVPVQVARVSLLESFCQSFEFEGKTTEEKEANIDVALDKLLGSANYQALKDLEGGARLDELEQGLCQSCGTASITLSIVPNSILSSTRFKFFVSGQGRYFIIMKKDSRIYYSADFRLLEEHHDASELAKGMVIVRFQQRLVNYLIANSNNYVSDEVIEVYVKIDTSQSRRNIYSIDYESKHEVRVADKSVGYLIFEKPDDKYDKIIDFKGVRYLRNRY